jgi:hypothetical protein
LQDAWQVIGPEEAPALLRLFTILGGWGYPLGDGRWLIDRALLKPADGLEEPEISVQATPTSVEITGVTPAVAETAATAATCPAQRELRELGPSPTP